MQDLKDEEIIEALIEENEILRDKIVLLEKNKANRGMKDSLTVPIHAPILNLDDGDIF